MGYRYENKLDEERDLAYWKNAPWWHKILTRLAYILFILLAFWSSIDWIIAKFINWLI